MNIGILGGGQLGWMTILEGRKLGFTFYVLESKKDSPAGKIADGWFHPSEVNKFLERCDVITYEFEHIHDSILEKVAPKTVPSVDILKIKNSRVKEKEFLRKRGYPVVRFDVSTTDTLQRKVEDFGLPCVIKSEKLGYDGRGQYKIYSPEDVKKVLENHPPEEVFVIEELVNFEFEASVIGVRSIKGELKFYPVTVNFHSEGVLLYNFTQNTPFDGEMRDIVRSLIGDLDIYGLLAVEFFITKDGRVLINEFAPRPHNTGHYSLDGSYTSQFENLLRALTGMPLGSTELKLPSGMVNILGLSLEDFDVNEVLSVEGAKLYWYGKEKKIRRKMGHVNVVAKDLRSLKEKIEKIIRIIYHESAVSV